MQSRLTKNLAHQGKRFYPSLHFSMQVCYVQGSSVYIGKRWFHGVSPFLQSEVVQRREKADCLNGHKDSVLGKAQDLPDPRMAPRENGDLVLILKAAGSLSLFMHGAYLESASEYIF